MTHGSEAYQRFLASTVMDYEKWHDGEGYDLGTLQVLTAAERRQVEDLMIGRTIEWREIEVLESLGTPRSWKAIDQAFTSHRNIDTRLAAATALHRSGNQSQPMDQVIAEAILELVSIEAGLTRALLLAEEHPTDRVRRALLRASGKKTEIAMHCAALLCYLAGKAKDPFDWDLRPLFLRLAPGNDPADRKAAYGELCALVEMTP
jgi:hypothetical protein